MVSFIAPDAFADLNDATVEDVPADMGWKNAITFHEKLRRINDPVLKEKVRASVVRAILEKARDALGSVSRPYSIETAAWDQHPAKELDLDVSLEEDPLLDRLLVEIRQEHRAEVIVCLDTSLSMTGRKLALLGVSVGTMALQLTAEDLSIINFESEAHLVKPLGSYMSAHQIVEKFIGSPARGLTNMEAALKLALQQCARGRQRKRHVILMSDGRFTAGARPEYLIPQLPKLHVVQMGNPWSNNRFFRRMARLGDGKFIQVKEFEDLPRALYTLVHEILR